ncbi:MAG: segregation/condensation protein A [Myxococcota bacterium]
MVLSPDEPVTEASAPESVADEPEGFRVSLGVFDGPFDLLLTLLSKHELDITEVSLSRVTQEFIAYLHELDVDEEMEQASEFLVVAATLLDMKVAGLLPQGELVDAESVALLEARDLLFARLLQYRAFKEVSGWFAGRLRAEDLRHTRAVRLDEKYRQAVPELVWTLTLDDFAALAILAITPKEIPHVGLDHLHAPLVSIREQAALETLAVIAYKQPVTRGQVASIRAVNVDSVVRTLLARGLITEEFTDAETGAIHYGTTDALLVNLGINSLDELPHISPLLDDGADGFDEMLRA